MRHPARLATLTALIVSVSALAAASQMVVTIVPSADLTRSVLHRADLTSGGLLPVGDVGHPVRALAFDPSGDLFGIDALDDRLLRIDHLKGGGEIVGPLGVDVSDGNLGLAFDDDGRLWMSAYVFGRGHELYELDPEAGTARLVGPLDERASGGLTMRDGELLGMGYQLFTIDRTTAGHEPLPESEAGAFVSLGLDHDRAGRLWTILLCRTCAGPEEVLQLARIDPSSGEQKVVEGTVPLPQGLRGLAIRPSFERSSPAVGRLNLR